MEFNPPYALDADGWDEFNERFRKEAPIRYFLTKVVGFEVSMIGTRISRAIWWVRHRTINRYHVVKTGLEPGWCDTDEKMLYTCFTMLVDYVEQECAWMHVVFDADKREKALGYRRFIPRIIRNQRFRDREAGLAHLAWEMTLNDSSLPIYERSPHQAEKARVVTQLYLWWVDERPKREELAYPLEDSPGGLITLSAKWKAENPEKSESISNWAKESHVIEKAWDDEDTLMLMKLVKIRKGLWT